MRLPGNRVLNKSLKYGPEVEDKADFSMSSTQIWIDLGLIFVFKHEIWFVQFFFLPCEFTTIIIIIIIVTHTNI
jgi:hypothetical protein